MTIFHQAEDEERVQVAQLSSAFRQRYAELRPRIEAGFWGQHIVINVQTGAYFIAPTREKAFESAEKALGSSDYCWTRRIGAR